MSIEQSYCRALLILHQNHGRIASTYHLYSLTAHLDPRVGLQCRRLRRRCALCHAARDRMFANNAVAMQRLCLLYLCDCRIRVFSEVCVEIFASSGPIYANASSQCVLQSVHNGLTLPDSLSGLPLLEGQHVQRARSAR